MSSTTSGTRVMITANKSVKFLFSATLGSNKKKVKIQAKNKLNSEIQYYTECTEDSLKKMGFYQSIKGFYKRLTMAIESKSPDELKVHYTLQFSSMKLTLEEISKFDDETTKWTMSLKKKTVQKSEKTHSSPHKSKSSSNLTNNSSDQIQFVVKQVKEKFAHEKEERYKLEERIQALEALCTKLTKKLVKVSNDLKKERKGRNRTESTESDDIFGSKSEKGSVSKLKLGTVGIPYEENQEMENRVSEMKANMDALESKWGNELHIINQKMDDIRPKLVRLKTRRDFASEQAFIDYITNKLEQWDANKFGPILVRVMQSATGKAKHFIGYVGEPQKWNHSICKVQWFGLGKKLPEAVEWKALDVFLPLSSFYYPDCPHARAYASRKEKSKQQL